MVGTDSGAGRRAAFALDRLRRPVDPVGTRRLPEVLEVPEGDQDSGGRLALATVIQELRQELVEAMIGGENQRLRFELGPVELDLTVVVGRELKPGAKVRFWVVEAGADSTLSKQTTQRIHLTMQPRDTQAPPDAAGQARSPLVTGSEVRGER
jgi:Trypsin-co-occurring domain 2